MCASNHDQDADRPNPAAQLGKLIGGYPYTQMIYVAAELGIADLLNDGPATAEALAHRVGADSDALYRVLRGLTTLGVFAETDDRRFELTPTAELLRPGVPGSLRAYAIMSGADWNWRPYGGLLDSVKTGMTAFEHVFGNGIFDYLSGSDKASQVFNDVMTDFTAMVANPVMDAYDFSGLNTIVDVGGGHGSLLAAILNANPEARGVVFDLPSAAEGAMRVLDWEGVAERCEVVSGDFFRSVPAGADAYILKWTIHDWNDEMAVRILRSCREGMNDQSRVMLMEKKLPRGNEPSPYKIADIGMLVLTGGRERTEAEYRELLEMAGLRLTRTVPTETVISVIEAVPSR